MKKEKGISRITLLLILVVIFAAIYFWFQYFSEPLTSVVTGGAEQSLPALDTAKKVSDKASKAVQATEDTTSKLNEEKEK